jgi:hypothetical protein
VVHGEPEVSTASAEGREAPVVGPLQVRLSYFKESGKWYADAAYISLKTQLFEIWEEVRLLRKSGHLPGLSAGSDRFLILVDVPDHPHRHPHMLILR